MELRCEQRPQAQMPAIGPLGPVAFYVVCWVKDLTVIEDTSGNLKSSSTPHPSVGEEMEACLNK